VVEEGPVAEVFTNPRSPHNRELIEAIPGQRTVARARQDTPPAVDDSWKAARGPTRTGAVTRMELAQHP